MFNYLLIGNIAAILLFALAAIVSVVLHELAHGYVALWNGDYTAKLNGRLSFNPLAHFDAVGVIMLLFVGFGYAKPVPVNQYNFRHRKRGLFAVAIAGVTLNIILAFISCGLMYLMNFLGAKLPSAAVVLSFFEIFFYYLMIINVNLFLFNLLPIYPLDGFRIIETFTSPINRVAKFLRDYGALILLLLVGIGFIASLIPVPFLQYFDVLGLYVSYGNQGITWLFRQFWCLIF